MTTFTRRALGALAAITLVFGGGVTAAAASAQTTPLLTNIRTGQHPDFDRIVLDLSGTQRPQVLPPVWGDELRADGSGDVVWLTGEHFLTVVSTPVDAHHAAGDRSYANAEKFRTRDLRNVMAVAVTGDFEAHVSIGIGTRARTWVRTSTLTSPTRVVIDVGHLPR